jgi:3-deoxy-manno-octulosonate cytidylyltransferase (CMP-KDO synthetase)
MIVHVFKRAQLSPVLDEVIVATDSSEIFDIVTAAGGNAVITSNKHKTGTDRIAEVAAKKDCDIIVNIQGDEPLLDPDHIDKVVSPIINNPDMQVSVLVTPYSKSGSSSDIKAVLDLEGNILYCSRADIPDTSRVKIDYMWKMCFIVSFRKDFLMQYTTWEQTPLENIEYNEYLRILEHGYKIRAVSVDNAVISVDTMEDLEIIREKMKQDKIKLTYM